MELVCLALTKVAIIFYDLDIKVKFGKLWKP